MGSNPPRCPKCNHEYCGVDDKRKITEELKFIYAKEVNERDGEVDSFRFHCGTNMYEVLMHGDWKKLFYKTDAKYCCICGDYGFKYAEFDKDYEKEDVGEFVEIATKKNENKQGLIESGRVKIKNKLLNDK